MMQEEKRDGEGRRDVLSEISSYVGVFPAFVSFQVMLFLGTAVLFSLTNTTESPEEIPTSPFGIACLIAWSGGAAFVWGRLKYSRSAKEAPENAL